MNQIIINDPLNGINTKINVNYRDVKEGQPRLRQEYKTVDGKRCTQVDSAILEGSGKRVLLQDIEKIYVDESGEIVPLTEIDTELIQNNIFIDAITDRDMLRGFVVDNIYEINADDEKQKQLLYLLAERLWNKKEIAVIKELSLSPNYNITSGFIVPFLDRQNFCVEIHTVSKKRELNKPITLESNPGHSKEISAAILNQLGGRKFIMMTGATNLLAGDNYLQFKLKRGSAKNGINIVRITLDPTDTYKVEFLKVNYRSYSTKTIKEFDNIYADQLREIFEQETGLYTSLRENPNRPTKEFWKSVYPDVLKKYLKKYDPMKAKEVARKVVGDIWYNKIKPKTKSKYEKIRMTRESNPPNDFDGEIQCPGCNSSIMYNGAYENPTDNEKGTININIKDRQCPITCKTTDDELKDYIWENGRR